MARESKLNSPLLSSDDEQDDSDSQSESLHATPNPPPAVAGDDSDSDASSDSESTKPMEVEKPKSLASGSKTEAGVKPRAAEKVSHESESGSESPHRAAAVKPTASSKPVEAAKPKSLGSKASGSKTEAGVKRKAGEKVSHQAADESETDSDSDSGSGSESQYQASAAKPTASSKPMEAAKSKSAGIKASGSKNKAGVKRRATESGLPDSKRAGKKAVGEQVDKKKDPKRKLFERLFSDDDEILILKGIMEYVKNNGADPFSDMKGFLDSIQNSLHVEINTTQLQDKMRRLKKRFENIARKAKPGKEKVFTKPHDNEFYAWSKKIWAPDGRLLGVVSSNPSQMPAKAVVSPQVDNLAEGGQIGKFSQLMLPIKLGTGKTVGGPTVEEEIFVDGWKYIEGSKKLEMEEKWRKLYFEEMEHSLKKQTLIKEHTDLVLEGMKAKGI